MVMMESRLWKRTNKKHDKMSLLKDSVRCRMSDMPRDAVNQVADEIRVNKARVRFQLDGSTDVSICRHVLVYCSVLIWTCW